MYRTIHDFMNDWGYEAESTMRMMERLTDDSLEQRVTPDGRSLGFLAWHIVVSLHNMLKEAGIEIGGANYGSPVPSAASEIAAGYEAAATNVMREVGTWGDEKLPMEVRVYGQNWTYGSMLRSLIDHQVHHRGQMTVLMRQAGLTVPGVYGPAREEWVAMGVPAHP